MFKLTLLLFIMAMIIVSCSHYDELNKNGKESITGSTESHNSGKNCMTCHNQSGNEAVSEGGWWNIAGTAYNNGAIANNGFIELWTQPNQKGKRIYQLPIDAKGNFYTAKIVNFEGGFYPVLLDKDKNPIDSMNTKINTGNCSSCHGVSTNLISF